MSFITAEQVRAVRMKGSKTVHLDELDKDILVVKMSSSKSLVAGDLSAEAKKGDSAKKAEFMVFMFEHGLADTSGVPLTHEDAVTLFDILPIETTMKLLSTIGSLTGDTVVPKSVSSGKK